MFSLIVITLFPAVTQGVNEPWHAALVAAVDRELALKAWGRRISERTAMLSTRALTVSPARSGGGGGGARYGCTRYSNAASLWRHGSYDWGAGLTPAAAKAGLLLYAHSFLASDFSYSSDSGGDGATATFASIIATLRSDDAVAAEALSLLLLRAADELATNDAAAAQSGASASADGSASASARDPFASPTALVAARLDARAPLAADWALAAGAPQGPLLGLPGTDPVAEEPLLWGWGGGASGRGGVNGAGEEEEAKTSDTHSHARMTTSVAVHHCADDADPPSSQSRPAAGSALALTHAPRALPVLAVNMLAVTRDFVEQVSARTEGEGKNSGGGSGGGDFALLTAPQLAALPLLPRVTARERAALALAAAALRQPSAAALQGRLALAADHFALAEDALWRGSERLDRAASAARARADLASAAAAREPLALHHGDWRLLWPAARALHGALAAECALVGHSALAGDSAAERVRATLAGRVVTPILLSLPSQCEKLTLSNNYSRNANATSLSYDDACAVLSAVAALLSTASAAAITPVLAAVTEARRAALAARCYGCNRRCATSDHARTDSSGVTVNDWSDATAAVAAAHAAQSAVTAFVANIIGSGGDRKSVV